jgi:hypothetical protein
MLIIFVCIFIVLTNATGPKLDKNFTSQMFTQTEKSLLRKEARDMFYHAYSSYINHGFPSDEVCLYALQLGFVLFFVC